MNGRVTLFPERLMIMVLALLVSIPVLADPNVEKGLAIAKEAELRGDGFGDFTATMDMILKNKQGDTSTRHIRIMGLEVKGDGDKSLSIFDEPADVRGTAMLTYSHKTSPDDQWLYMPALKRVKRIASNNKSGPYMGSEFAYEDIASQELEKYTYKYLRDEVYEGEECFVVERYPVDENSGYKRQIVWLDKAEYRPLKTDFYDRKDTLLKTLTNKGYKRYLQHQWRPDEMFMENVQNGKTTRILWKNYRFNTGLAEKDFQVDDLKRAR